ncbi:MAG UNVERIFIED_CONTAM: hypothetical protein LVR18_41205 [Planctomycetaceae bacterium]
MIGQLLQSIRALTTGNTRRRRNVAKSSHAAQIQSLEDRQLLAAAIVHSWNDVTLQAIRDVRPRLRCARGHWPWSAQLCSTLLTRLMVAINPTLASRPFRHWPPSMLLSPTPSSRRPRQPVPRTCRCI